ncbi:MAG: AAA family ATPase [Dehalococcoidia bacterium]|nr:AAA family ATPase [Dehalococcoidia bacterium]
MGTRIVSTGRGGTGKTTFTALATKYLEHPLLLIDIDPDQSLADMLGVDIAKADVRTVLDILYDLQKKGSYEELGTMPLPEKIDYLFNTECIYESKNFDLVSLGVKWTEGCYCAPNNLLRGIIPRLSQSYSYTLIDAPAGLEHLNRNVTSDIDDIFLVLDPSLKSMKNIERIQKLAQEVGIRYKNLYLIANYRFNEETEETVRGLNGSYLGKVAYDARVEEYNLAGKSLLELPDDSPAAQSVRQILIRAGYRVRPV